MSGRSILKLLTEEQLNRYEAFRRSSLARRNMKRVSGSCKPAAQVWGAAVVGLHRHDGPYGAQMFSLCLMQLQQTIVGQQVNLNMTIVMCGIAKVFVGELIEAGVVRLCRQVPKVLVCLQLWHGCARTEFQPGLLTAAREIAEQRGEQGPLRVHHVHEAYQQLDREGRIPHRTPQQQHMLR